MPKWLRSGGLDMALPASGVISLAQIRAEFGGAAPDSLSEYYKGGAYVSASDTAPNVPASGQISLSNFYGAAKNVVGQVEYTTPGTYSWTCPAGVTSVCVVAVGAGGFDGLSGGSGSSAGSGGNLAYGNNIPVTPGNTYTVKVGAPVGISDYATSRSYFISTSALMAGGGQGTDANGSAVTTTSEANAGTYLTGGGKGGNGGGYLGGGGGAGGYAGAGGAGGAGSPSTGANGSGGGGGGGGAASSSGGGGGGGGVGLLGQGANGTGGNTTGTGGTAGSGGSSGSAIPTGGGGNYGGGGGFRSTGVSSAGNGAVRIIWGAGRAFPSTNTGNL